MTLPVGGERDRLIIESVQRLVRDMLEDLGWLDAGRGHQDITLIYRELDESEEAEPNTLALFADSIDGDDLELGSNLAVDVRTFYLDFFGDPGDEHIEALGEHLMGDMRDGLKGKLPDIGREHPHVEVCAWGQATPTTLFFCPIEDVVKDRGRNPSNASQKLWWTVRFDVVAEGV